MGKIFERFEKCRRFCIIISCLAGLLPAAGYSAKVEFVRSGASWQMLRDGQPYFAKGAGGSQNLDLLKASGGNSIRTWGADGRTLDNAQSRGMTVCLGISADEAKARDQVNQFKNHPALLVWGIGNEEENKTNDDIGLWQRINRIAQMIHDVDGNHPAITVVAEIGGNKLRDIMQHAPNLDGIGINTYGGIMSMPRRVDDSGWDKPYLVTEFGPRGHWEVAKEEWNVPIEQSTTEKKEYYLEGYREGVENQPKCLGSYVFLWGQKQEKTHTWYGMFLPGDLGGNPLSPIDAMTVAWTGTAPENHAPDIGPDKILVGTNTAIGDGSKRYFPPGFRFRVALDAADQDGDPITIAWDLRNDVTDNSATGGAFEPSTEPIAGAVISSEGNTAVIQLPNREGKFRIHAYVYDDKGKAATVNQGIVSGNQYTILEPENPVKLNFRRNLNGYRITRLLKSIEIRLPAAFHTGAELLSMEGKTLTSTSGNGPLLSLNTAGTPPGVYFVNIRARGEILSSKILVNSGY